MTDWTVINHTDSDKSLDYKGVEIFESTAQFFPTATIIVPWNSNVSIHDEIYFKEDGTTKFGGYVHEIKDDKKGRQELIVYGYGSEWINTKEDVDYSSRTPQYVVEDLVPTGVPWEYTYSGETPVTAVMTTYKSLNTRGAIYREMNLRTGWHIYINVSKVVNFYSESAQSSGVTLTSGSGSNVVNWGTKLDGYVKNRVDVLGFDASGTAIEGTATDATSITNYGEHYSKVQFQYLADATEANAIATALLKTTPASGGKVDSTNNWAVVPNKSVTVVDSVRSISGAYTIQAIRRVFPKNIMTVDVGFSNADEYLAQRQTEADSTATDLRLQNAQFCSILGDETVYGNYTWDANKIVTIGNAGKLQFPNGYIQTGGGYDLIIVPDADFAVTADSQISLISGENIWINADGYVQLSSSSNLRLWTDSGYYPVVNRQPLDTGWSSWQVATCGWVDTNYGGGGGGSLWTQSGNYIYPTSGEHVRPKDTGGSSNLGDSSYPWGYGIFKEGINIGGTATARLYISGTDKNVVITTAGRFATGLFPETPNLYDFGDSTQKWRNLYCSGDITCDDITGSGNCTFASGTGQFQRININASSSDYFYLSGSFANVIIKSTGYFGSHLIPDLTDYRNLGDTDHKWWNIYCSATIFGYHGDFLGNMGIDGELSVDDDAFLKSNTYLHNIYAYTGGGDNDINIYSELDMNSKEISEISYLNGGSTLGSGGYGIRNSGGRMQFKHNTGSWQEFATGSSGGSAIYSWGQSFFQEIEIRDSWEHVLDSSVNVSVPSGGKVLILCSWIADWNDDGESLDTEIARDGSRITSTHKYQNNSDDTDADVVRAAGSTMYMDSPTAGSHTYSLHAISRYEDVAVRNGIMLVIVFN